MSPSDLTWRATTALHTALGKAIATLESEIKGLAELHTSEKQVRAHQYWEKQITEAEVAIEQLKFVAANLDAVKWDRIKEEGAAARAARTLP